MSTRVRASGLTILAVLLLLPRGLTAQHIVDFAPAAAQDRPAASGQCQWDAMLKASQPFVERARASLPGALSRFQNGLPEGQSLMVIVRLADSLGHHEQAFMVVDSVTKSRLIGRIWNPIASVQGYHMYQRHTVRRGDVVDWMISKPDGSEEGNEVGKFLDSYWSNATCDR